DFELGSQCGTQLTYPVRVAAGFFDSDNVLTLTHQPLNGLNAYLDTASARDAIKHNRQVGVASDFTEVLKKPILDGFVVIRGDLQGSVRAESFSVFRQINRFVSRVGT